MLLRSPLNFLESTNSLQLHHYPKDHCLGIDSLQVSRQIQLNLIPNQQTNNFLILVWWLMYFQK